ncbi:RNAse III [Malonomonas rubra DSM 5091]|uniref:Ribonuclease 3 n=1 Tax=Malonomonas rubra DSM 5091 TaxID=1122189 RepID=A0A1M6DGI6_MALRU|nr:ribonuclease III [Malonomonas rubra]SHI72290.1 RNAse III [Malonomonas rubra DSM 5091]
MSDYIAGLEAALDYRFGNADLPLQALTHKSFSNEQSDPTLHNERLEFLGDAVLELAVSERIYRRYPDIPEGGLTRIRAEVVCEGGLARIARKLNLGNGLRLGKGEEKSGGREKESLLSDALEALLGAVYCDGGFDAACAVVERIFGKAIDVTAKSRYGTDYKTCLQERLQAGYGRLPEYKLCKVSGPDHERVFSMEVRFDGKLLGSGSGPSKKRAEQQAAAAALDHALVRKCEMF